MHEQLNATDTIEILKIYVDLKDLDDHWRGYCPFCHRDGYTFHVIPDEARWFCTRCGVAGDVYDFFVHMRDCSRADAERFVTNLAAANRRHPSGVEKLPPSMPPLLRRRPQSPPQTPDFPTPDVAILSQQPTPRASQLEAAPSPQAVPVTSPWVATVIKTGVTGVPAARVPVEPLPATAASPLARPAAPVPPAPPIPPASLEVAAPTQGSGARPETIRQEVAPSPSTSVAPPPSTAASPDLAQMAARLNGCFQGAEKFRGVALIHDDPHGEPVVPICTLRGLDHHDALALDRLMRLAQAGVAQILPGGDPGQSLFCLTAERKAEVLKLIWVPIEQGGLRFRLILSTDPSLAEALFIRRLRSCLGDAMGHG